MEIENPHDKFFKHTFSDENVAKNFLENYLPRTVLAAIDTNSLKLQKDSFISNDLKERFSDLLYKIDINGETGYFYFLFEHKSYVSYDIFTQLLRYMADIWDKKMTKKNNWELPMVIPLVIYQGEKNWIIPKRLGDLLKGYHKLNNDLRKHIPDFEYLFYNLTDYRNSTTNLDTKLIIYLRVIQAFSKTKQEDAEKIMIEITQYFLHMTNESERKRFLLTTLTYVYTVVKDLDEENEERINDLVSKQLPGGSDVIVTLAERYIEKGRVKGRVEGKAEGRTEGKTEIIKKLIIKGLPTREISELTELPKNEIEQIKKEIEK